LHLTVYKTDGDVSYVDVATSAPTRDPAHLHSLFRDKVERINPGFGFDLITLAAGAVEEMQHHQNRLDGGSDDDLHLARLIDRLSAKFGPHAVARPVLRQSHMPERAEAQIAALADHTDEGAVLTKERPLRLLDHPEEVRVLYAVPEGPPAQFVWRRQTHKVVRYAGPERIAPEWWKDRPGTRLRDYFKVEDQSGRRLWLYREGLHEDGRGGDPRWFVHGFFA
jgi:protein ImuB